MARVALHLGAGRVRTAGPRGDGSATALARLIDPSTGRNVGFPLPTGRRVHPWESNRPVGGTGLTDRPLDLAFAYFFRGLGGSGGRKPALVSAVSRKLGRRIFLRRVL